MGYLGDGLFKAVLAAVYALAAAPIGRLLGVDVPLILLTAGILLLSGVAEIVFARRRAAQPYIWYLVGYDSGWLVLTALALILAGQGSSAGGELWFAYQALGSVVLATAFAIGARSRPASQRAAAGT
ncbi:hypothetical protein [Ruania zhangjianzhongii]|uniref:hypothetical protein n=1 Tax=Ruania zhangjianzhongii TaxID=2603206 RepID=UPI001AEF5EBE|nr:hypothetical protein [Ruania zhangjianzhongii]